MSLSQVESIGEIDPFVADDVLLLQKLSLHSLKLLGREDGSRALADADVGVDGARRCCCRRRRRRVDIFDAGMPDFCRRRRTSVVSGKAVEGCLMSCNKKMEAFLKWQISQVLIDRHERDILGTISKTPDSMQITASRG